MGRIESFDLNAAKLTATCDLELGMDYWISECGPGDEVVFPSSSTAHFALEGADK